VAKPDRPPRKDKYHQIVEGEWVPVRKRGHRNSCCDCGLVHHFAYRVTAAGRIEFQALVDRRATSAMRRAFKFTKEQDE
jgi:hypothetical protein